MIDCKAPPPPMMGGASRLAAPPCAMRVCVGSFNLGVAGIPPPHLPAKKSTWSWRSQAFRGLNYQVLAVGLIAFVTWFLARNTMHNMQVRAIQSGFDFLTQPAGFDIDKGPYPLDSGEPCWFAFLMGVVNTSRSRDFLSKILGH